MNDLIMGEHISLKPITYADTDLIVRWRNNDAVRQNFVYRETFTPQIHEKWMKTQVETGRVVQHIIQIKETGWPIGSVYFRDVDFVNHSAEFGIFIGENSARGKGFGREAVSIYCQYGFDSLGFHRIFLRVFTDNITAINSYKRAGFAEEGIARDLVLIDGVYRDMLFMSKITQCDR